MRAPSKAISFVMFASLAILSCSNTATPSDAAVATDATEATDASVGTLPQRHRVSAVECSHDRAAGNAESFSTEMCASDADCTEGINGRCLHTVVAARFNYCSYDDCFTDSACAAEQVCLCREAAIDPNVCATGNCTVDADCGANGFCSPSAGYDRVNFGVAAYYCHTSLDTCVNDDDCPQDGGIAKCTYFPDRSRWACSATRFEPP